ncbi:MAG: chromosome segregation protein SMC [Azospira oryzae]|jgi:predicted ATPase|nr:MAG: chromosome segregation protein SMC [Azospira oryzae]
MKIEDIRISGFKSIGDITLSNPNPFSVFVGPNAAGKSNIFEALELLSLCNIMDPSEATSLFGSSNDLLNQNFNSQQQESSIQFEVNLGSINPTLSIYFVGFNGKIGRTSISDFGSKSYTKEGSYNHLKDQNYIQFSNFTRLFTGKESIVKRKIIDDTKLAIDGSNLEKVLKRILKEKKKRDEILEILQLLIPGFDNIEIKTEELSGSDNLLIFEESLNKPLPKRLISDGTYNIIAIIAALYQSDTPQFLCIEEPENGLNPKVVKQLVSILRDKCKEEGHYIWLNTHSQTLVAELQPEEIILVDKVNGLTQVKQIADMDLHGMKMDEALLTNTLGGGIPW